MRTAVRIVLLVMLIAVVLPAFAQQPQPPPPTPEERLRRSWNDVMKKLVEMAEDFPEDKYTFKPHPESRSFGEELMHVAAVNTRIARQARGETVDNAALQKEFAYVSKADTVAKLKKSVGEVQVVVDSPDCLRLIGALEHAGEEYGKLTIHYRVNGLVPPRGRRQAEN
ncbi:MAG TPA: DinB family protein [Candidatus Xenobia bacterium]|nr:DinB family protein [Candidatus Xenobia bacterium]